MLRLWPGRLAAATPWGDMDEFLNVMLRAVQTGAIYATIAVGCTGGKHRSVAVAEELARRLRALDRVSVQVTHRDMGRE